MLRTKYEISCDGGSRFRDKYCTERVEDGVFKSSVKRQAKAAGWKRVRTFLLLDDEWICPKCQAAARGELPPERDWGESPEDHARRVREWGTARGLSFDEHADQAVKGVS